MLLGILDFALLVPCSYFEMLGDCGCRTKSINIIPYYDTSFSLEYFLDAHRFEGVYIIG